WASASMPGGSRASPHQQRQGGYVVGAGRPSVSRVGNGTYLCRESLSISGRLVPVPASPLPRVATMYPEQYWSVQRNEPPRMTRFLRAGLGGIEQHLRAVRIAPQATSSAFNFGHARRRNSISRRTAPSVGQLEGCDGCRRQLKVPDLSASTERNTAPA